MNVTGTLLVSHGILIALLAGLLLRESPVEASAANEVLAACEGIRRDLDALQAIVLNDQKLVSRRREPAEREPIPTGVADAARVTLPKLDELTESIRSLEARVSRVSTGPPNLDEIHESYPTMNWAGWEAHKRRCGVGVETIAARRAQARTAREPNAVHAVNSKLAAALSRPVRMKKSHDILELFGSPSEISIRRIQDSIIVWIYRSPDAEEAFVVYFSQGFVTSLRSTLLDRTILAEFR